MWSSLLCGETHAAACESICAISSELFEMETSSLSATGLCEHALLYAYLGQADSNVDWHDKCLACLDLAVERLSVIPPSHDGLYGGLAGFGWMLQHCLSILESGRRETIQDSCDDDDPLAELDVRLLGLSEDNSFDSRYDLITGYVGVGVYWLERLPRKPALDGLRHILVALDTISRSTPLGITWFTPPNLVPPTQIDRAPSGYYNLGVAHGVPGVIAFLAQVAGLGYADDVTKKASVLLAGAMNWLLAQRRPPDSISRYSSWAIPGQDCGDSRIAWCYGDLGIAAILRVVAERTRNPFWEIEARNLTDSCIFLRPEMDALDAPLCHGAFGNAHIFNRLFQAFHVDAYKKSSDCVVSQGLDTSKAGRGRGWILCLEVRIGSTRTT